MHNLFSIFLSIQDLCRHRQNIVLSLFYDVDDDAVVADDVVVIFVVVVFIVGVVLISYYGDVLLYFSNDVHISLKKIISVLMVNISRYYR